MIPLSWITAAGERLEDTIENTPLTYDAAYDVFIKWESCQLTGSFKVRGALNRVLTMPEWERQRGLVCASAGNHGLGVAFAGQRTQTDTIVYLPESCSQIKIDGIQTYGAQVRLVPGGYAAAEETAKSAALAESKSWVSPYNDGQIIAGQGTIALEILADYPDTAAYTWVVPVGGGGLISGIVSCLQDQNPTSVIGVQAQASPFFHSLYHYGHQAEVQEFPTLAEGLTGAIEDRSITIPIVRKSVADLILVSEADLLQAIAYAWEKYGEPMEPSGAAGLAAVLSGKITSRPVVVIVSGGNISPVNHLKLVRQHHSNYQGV